MQRKQQYVSWRISGPRLPIRRHETRCIAKVHCRSQSRAFLDQQRPPRAGARRPDVSQGFPAAGGAKVNVNLFKSSRNLRSHAKWPLAFNRRASSDELTLGLLTLSSIDILRSHLYIHHFICILFYTVTSCDFQPTFDFPVQMFVSNLSFNSRCPLFSASTDSAKKTNWSWQIGNYYSVFISV